MAPAGRRPNTVLPTEKFTVSIEDLNKMTDLELKTFADKRLSLYFGHSATRKEIIDTIITAGVAIKE